MTGHGIYVARPDGIDPALWAYGIGAVHGLIAAVEEHRFAPDGEEYPYDIGWWNEYVVMAEELDA